jgi:hypothetical protein
MNKYTPRILRNTERWISGLVFGFVGLSLSAQNLELAYDFESGMGDLTFSQAAYGTGLAEVTADPWPSNDPDNDVLSLRAGDVNTNNLALVAPIAEISDGGTGTVFFRYAVDSSSSAVNGGILVGPLEAPAGWGDTNVIFLPNSSGQLRFYDSSGYISLEESRNDMVWYKVWLVIDTAADTTDVYLQGGPYGEPTLVGEDLGFRKQATGENLVSMLFYLNSGGSGASDPNLNGTIYVDDIYVDTASANMNDPVPAAAPSPSFTLVSDFEAGMGGFTFTQNGFGNGNAEVVNDPFPYRNTLNGVLKVNAGDAAGNNIAVVGAIPTISEGDFGTVFMRYAIDTEGTTLNGGLMVSPIENPEGWGDTNIILNPNSSGKLQYRDGSVYTELEAVRTDQVWYKAWIIANTAADTSSLYLQGGAYTEPTLVAENFGFRKDEVGEDLMSLLFYLNAGNPGTNNGSLYIDDIYVDTHAANFSDPSLAATIRPLPTLESYSTDSAITIDGTMDPSYRNSSATGWFSGSMDSAEDLSAVISTTWDSAGLYVFVDVMDEVTNADDGQPSYTNDSIQFAIDPDNSDGESSYDGVNDIAFVGEYADGGGVVRVASFPTPPSGADDTNLNGVVVSTATGYAMEVFIPWATLQVEPMGDWVMGLGMAINDDDGNDLNDPADGIADREGQGGTWGAAGMNLNNSPALFGNLVLQAPKRHDIRPVDSPMTIDGTKDSSYGGSMPINRWIDPGSSPMDTSAAWTARYDADNLYVIVEIVDDSVVAAESTDAWEDDALALFLDGNNSKSGSFDGEDDVKLIFTLTDSVGGVAVALGDGAASAPSGTDISGVEAAVAITDAGWNLEAKIPLSVIALPPVPGATFGVGFNIRDDDDGGDADGTLTWSGAAVYDEATHLMGTAQLYSLNEAVVMETEAAVVVDGDVDDAYAASGWNLIRRNSKVPQNDFGGYWSAAYDADYFYLVVDVYDDVIMNDSPDQLWNDDALEIYFDPSNDSLSGFDAVEDVKLTIASPIDGDVRLAYLAEDQFPDPPVGTDFTNLEVVWVTTTLGYRVEMRVPWVTLRTDPIAGHAMAFDVVMKDDDGAGVADNHFWSIIGSANSQTNLYGTVYLNGKSRFASEVIGAVVVSPYTYESDWFGVIYEPPSYGGWAYHMGLGWLYTAYASANGGAMWLYAEGVDAWVYTSPSLFPHLYIHGLGWGWLAPDSKIWDYQAGDWIDLND